MTLRSLVIISSLFIVVACGRSGPSASKEPDPEIEAEKMRLQRERERLEDQRAEFDREKAAEEEKKRREEVAKLAAHASEFSAFTQAVVVSAKCYFHRMPDPTTIKGSFLVQGDRVMVSKVKQNFVYVDFYNEYNGKSTSGWLDTQDLEPILGQ